MCAILHEKPIEQEGAYAGEPQTVNLSDCSWSYPHCCALCGQVQTNPYRTEDQDRYVQALNIHPEFDGRNLHNDFAVLFTSEDFVLSSHIDLPVVSNYECQDKLRSTRLGQKYKLHDSFICAGGVNGKDTCKG